MPADIVGSEVLEEADAGRAASASSRARSSPSLLMADEINRASPKTQSALLQAMQEHHVTVAGQRYDLPQPFHVLATQNPLEQEGTYPLPEAQLDRFLLQIDVGYPDLECREARAVRHDRRPKSAREGDPRAGTDALPAPGALDPGGEKVLDAILKPWCAARAPTPAVLRTSRPRRLGPKPARQPSVLARRSRPRSD